MLYDPDRGGKLRPQFVQYEHHAQVEIRKPCLEFQSVILSEADCYHQLKLPHGLPDGLPTIVPHSPKQQSGYVTVPQFTMNISSNNRTPRSVFCKSLYLLLVLFLSLSPTQATWYREYIDDGADIIMMDLRWPFWPSGSYFANWNTSFNPKPNNITFYAGFTSYLPDGENQKPNPESDKQDAFRPGSVWTFWGSDDIGTPVRFIDVAPNLFIKNDYGGEGSSGTTGAHVWPFVQRNQWYTMVSRVWKPTPQSNSLVGRWIKDHRTNQWHLIGIAQLPIPATSFTGNSGFLEPLTSEKAVRSIHRRLGYFRKDGTWRSSNTISIDKTQYVVVNTLPEDNHEYTAIEYAQRPDNLPLLLKGNPIDGKELHKFTAKQPQQPQLDLPQLESLRAVASADHIAVSWTLPTSSSPPLRFDIELYDNMECVGEPIHSQQVNLPTARHAIVSGSANALAVAIRMTDIFDQQSKAITGPIALVKIASPKPLEAPTIPGLHYELWTKDEKRKQNYFNPPEQQPDEEHTWIHLDERTSGKKQREGISRGFDTSIRNERDQGFAIRYTGYLEIPSDGPYILSAQIDGAYRIELNGYSALEWDGQHGTTEKSNALVLAKGHHPITVEYLVDQLPSLNFHIYLEGPNISKHPISMDELCTTSDGPIPNLVIDTQSSGDGTATIQVKDTTASSPIRQLDLYLDRWQLKSSTTSELLYKGPLPRGTSTLWARATMEDGRTIDSKPIDIDNVGPAISDAWVYRNVGDQKASAGLWQRTTDSFDFFGSGMHTVTQHVKGDFVAQCRITQYNGSNGEPVNRRAWVGLSTREFGDRKNWEWGRDFHLVQTAADGLRASADFTDFGAGRISSYSLAPNHPWLRISRQGDVWTAWSSPDGSDWHLGALQYKKMAQDVDVGLFFSALPQDARAHYFASVSAVQVHQDPDRFPSIPTVRPPITTQLNSTDGNRWTGIVVAPTNPNIAILRSNHIGPWITHDTGKTWTSIAGLLQGSDLCVRSVAFDPQTPSTLYMATGNGSKSNLWKSSDFGKNWRKLTLQADFDGQGPSALCGEILAVDYRNPKRIFVGSESMGLFKSEDAGETFQLLGAQGERITSVVVWPWEKHYPAPARGQTHFCATTCADKWMQLLGRGSPTTSTATTISKSYITRDDAKSIVVSEQRDDCGFYNVAFDKAMQSTNEMRYATSHGYQTQVFEGWHMALYPPEKNLEWFTPYTAVAAAAQGDQKFGRFIAAPLFSNQPGRYSKSERWAFEWSWITPTTVSAAPQRPKGGVIAIACDQTDGRIWYFLHTDGLFLSTDGGETITKILGDQPGKPIVPNQLSE